MLMAFITQGANSSSNYTASNSLTLLSFVFVELCNAFLDISYNVKIINNMNEITNDSIVFMGDGFTVHNPASMLNAIAPNAIYIGWYWHRQHVSDLKYFIHGH